MKNTKFVVFVFLLALFILPGCSKQNSEQSTQTNTQQESINQNEINKIIEDFKEKYNAVDFGTDEEDRNYSVDTVDKYMDKNILAPILCIDDIFYDEKDMFLSAESWSDEMFLLKITPEQYSKIKTFSSDTANYDLYIVFRLDNIVPMVPTLNADFSFYISAPDDLSVDEDSHTSFDSRIIRGTLVDIIEVKRKE